MRFIEFEMIEGLILIYYKLTVRIFLGSSIQFIPHYTSNKHNFSLQFLKYAVVFGNEKYEVMKDLYETGWE